MIFVFLAFIRTTGLRNDAGLFAIDDIIDSLIKKGNSLNFEKQNFQNLLKKSVKTNSAGKNEDINKENAVGKNIEKDKETEEEDSIEKKKENEENDDDNDALSRKVDQNVPQDDDDNDNDKNEKEEKEEKNKNEEKNIEKEKSIKIENAEKDVIDKQVSNKTETEEESKPSKNKSAGKKSPTETKKSKEGKKKPKTRTEFLGDDSVPKKQLPAIVPAFLGVLSVVLLVFVVFSPKANESFDASTQPLFAQGNDGNYNSDDFEEENIKLDALQPLTPK